MYIIREANHNDIKDLCDCRVQLMKDLGIIKVGEDTATLEEKLNLYMNKELGTGFFVWVAEEEGKIVATSGLNIFSKPPTSVNLSGLEGYIMNMYVMPSYRRQGIAEALMKIILEYLKDNKIKFVRLQASEQGRSLYEKLGFTPYDDGMVFKI